MQFQLFIVVYNSLFRIDHEAFGDCSISSSESNSTGYYFDVTKIYSVLLWNYGN